MRMVYVHRRLTALQLVYTVVLLFIPVNSGFAIRADPAEKLRSKRGSEYLCNDAVDAYEFVQLRGILNERDWITCVMTMELNRFIRFQREIIQQNWVIEKTMAFYKLIV
eukprot:NODE_98_length_21025_cov_0.475055.p15 type:complete len:109 gc:universal NODE_98_length_21025_cov_0.475055:8939-8613(-)